MEHGGNLSEAVHRYGGPVDGWLDLSTGINPWPWRVPHDLAPSVWQRLPSRDAEVAAIDAARAAYQVPAAVAIIPAPGTQALIQWIPQLAADGAVAVVTPTYNEHAKVWKRSGHEVIEIGALTDLPDGAKHAVVVSPNNPDGRVTDRAVLAKAAEVARKRGGWLVVDMAFADLDEARGLCDLCIDFPVIVLRSFGKFYGLAGLRLGFAIASADIGTKIAAALGPWAVSGPALAIASRALSDRTWAMQMRGRLSAQATRVDEVLCTAGLAITGGTSLYRLARHPRAAEIHEHLAREKIWVRRFDWDAGLLRFGLPENDAALQRLAIALRSGV